ncbi:hypothetical protein M427DRAFT_140041 [Gonapodya prolifera JEL478]|uniref:Uncharacterized protein n=1 Tax=Gonapodya prolifera (strain JEL478) TaxID=1344416 RepID=A0A139A001_GONPJ|nr:hypothetical protein M427DRAFT_140041 [Gonapodya prolifera JEL478]|eukprot:KXS10090.1 hypothetical protein M427DRAFT_140041 [Gonapodya prolifera JEL478]
MSSRGRRRAASVRKDVETDGSDAEHSDQPSQDSEEESASDAEDDDGAEAKQRKRKSAASSANAKATKKQKLTAESAQEVRVSDSTIKFLKELAANNDREWFRTNKSRYDQAKAEFDRLARYVYQRLREVDPTLKDEDGAKMVFRIYRDVRFGGLPYKTHFAAGFGTTGRKGNSAKYYFQIGGEEHFTGAGRWQPESPTLFTIRSNLANDASRLKGVLEQAEFKKTFGNSFWDESDGNKLKTAPKGFDKNHDDIELLKFKSFTVGRKFTDADVVAENFAKKLVETLSTAVPFVAELNRLGR